MAQSGALRGSSLENAQKPTPCSATQRRQHEAEALLAGVLDACLYAVLQTALCDELGRHEQVASAARSRTFMPFPTAFTLARRMRCRARAEQHQTDERSPHRPDAFTLSQGMASDGCGLAPFAHTSATHDLRERLATLF